MADKSIPPFTHKDITRFVKTQVGAPEVEASTEQVPAAVDEQCEMEVPGAPVWLEGPPEAKHRRERRDAFFERGEIVVTRFARHRRQVRQMTTLPDDDQITNRRTVKVTTTINEGVTTAREIDATDKEIVGLDLTGTEATSLNAVVVEAGDVGPGQSIVGVKIDQL